MADTRKCPVCNGSGKTTCPGNHGLFFDDGAKCSICRGSGEVVCGTCGGSGKVIDEAKEREREQEREYDRMKELEHERAEHERELERERAERERESLEEQQYIAEQLAEEQRRTAEELVEKQREVARDSWKIQAQAKADRAFELIDTKLYKEGIVLLKEAIKEDPGNLQAYQGIAWAFHQTGQDKKATEFLKKQMLLLKSNENPDSSLLSWTLETIMEVQPNGKLWGDFSEIVVNYLSIPINPVIYLANRNELEKARSLYNEIVTNKKPLARKSAFNNKDEDIAVIRGVLLIQPDVKHWQDFLTTTANNLYDPFSAISWLLTESEVEKACSLFDATIALAENYKQQIVGKELELLLQLLNASAGSNFDWNKDNRVWKSFMSKAGYWDFEPSDVLYTMLGSAPHEITNQTFDGVRANEKITRLLGFVIGIELRPEQAKEISDAFLCNKSSSQRRNIIDEFANLKTYKKLSSDTLEKAKQILLDWYDGKRKEIETEFQQKSKEAFKSAQPNYLWGLGGGFVFSGFICLFGYVLSRLVSNINADFSGTLQTISCCSSFLSLLIVGGVLTFIVPKYLKSRKALSELRQQEEALFTRLPK